MVSINTNISSLLAQNNTRQVNNELEKAMERLSSGLRINSASDDAAGLAIASRMESQVRGLQAAIKNANDGISVTQTAEGAMEEIGNILQRMRELAVQSANDSNSDADRAYLQQEVAQLSDEITRISETTQYNGVNVLDGSFAGKTFQIGANANQSVSLDIANVAAASLGIGASSTSSTSSTTTTTSGVAEEIGSLSFDMDDRYAFQLTDRDTGLSYRIAPAAATAAISASVVSLDRVILTDHGFRTGDAFIYSSVGTVRYIIKIDEDTFQIASSYSNAIAGTANTLTTVTQPTITGLGMSLTRADADSRADFAARINSGLKESAVNTSVTGNAAAASVSASTMNASAASDDTFMFTLKIGDTTQDIDFGGRMLSTSLPGDSTLTAADYVHVAQAMREELHSVFDDSVSVTESSGVFTIEDAQGRYLEVSQGSGNGYFFGSDEQNSGSIYATATTQNNLSVAWSDDGSKLVVSHAAAGGVDISNFASTSTGTATFDVADTATTGVAEPIVLQDTLADSTASVRGIIGESKIALNFSDTFGYAADGAGTADTGLAAEYVFKITDGAGNVYADFSGSSSALDIQHLNNTDAAIEAFVLANLTAQITATGFNDNRIDVNEFDVEYTGGILTISNTEGRDLRVEDFSSAYGTITVSKLDGLEGTEVLSSQRAQTSEIRLERGFGTDLDSRNFNVPEFDFSVDGTYATSNLTVGLVFNLSGTAGGAPRTGWQQAAILERAFQGWKMTGTSTTQFIGDDNNFRVAYDSSTDEFVIVDLLGRELDIKKRNDPHNPLLGAAVSTGQYFKTAAAVGAANKANVVQIDSGVTSGVLTEASSVKLTFNQDSVAAFVLGVNGQTSTAAAFNFASDTFGSSAFKTALDGLMANLNTEYLGAPYSYSMDVDNRALTITNSKGGEIFFDGHTTTSTDLELQLDVMSGVLQNATDTSGNGDAVIKANEVVTVATATGDGDVETTTSTSTSSSSYSSGNSGIDQLTIATQTGANSALGSIDAALSTILSERAKLGALENRLDHTVNNLSNVVTNTSAAQGRIQDADFARETTNLTKSQILSQAATSMLAQANQSKQNILALLQ